MTDPHKPGPGPGGGSHGHHGPYQHQPHHLTLTQADQDIIKSFLSSVPAGFPLSPGTALAELSSFSPLSPSLPSSSYHFSLSPARNQDPPSPRHAEHQRYSYKTLHSPKRHHTPQRSSLAGFPSPKRGASSSHQSPQRPGVSRTHSPDLTRPRSPVIEFSQIRKDAFSSPAWSPQRQTDSPTYQLQPQSRSKTSYSTYLSPHHHSSPSHPSQMFEDNISDLHLGNKRSFDISHGDQIKRPRTSHSPTAPHSPPPRQSLEYSPLLPAVGSYSPRRSYFNPPNPYSPVNPPAPYSPRRVVSNIYSPPRVPDHRYYDSGAGHSPFHLTHPPSPTGPPSPTDQLTHPPSPSRNLDLSPTSSHIYVENKNVEDDPQDSVMEPLDLDIHHGPEPLLEPFPTKTSKPLTQVVNKRLGITKSKSKSKNRRSPASSKGNQDKKAPPSSSAPGSHLEKNLSEVTVRLNDGCGCDLKCFSGLDSDFVWKHRCNIAELSKGEHDMYLMGIMMASLANPRSTSKHKARQRNRNRYIFQGKEICQEAFLYLENVTVYQLKSIRKHVLDNGVVPRVHRNTGKKPHNVLELDHYQLSHRFVEDLLEKERGSGTRKKTFLADLTCKKLHSSYLKYFADLGMDNKTMAYSTFRHFVHERFPKVKFTSRETILGDSGGGGVSINMSASNRQDTVLSIETETHQNYD